MTRALCLIAALTFLNQGSLLRADTFTGTTGGSATVENRQPTLVTRYMIALAGVFPDNGGSDLSEGTPPSRTQPYLGEIKAVPFDFAPRGWVLCEGQSLQAGQNQALFALLGFNYGGDGVNTFKLPDLRGRVPMGVGQGFGLPNYVIGQQVGTATPGLTVANLPIHTHTVPASPNTLSAGGGIALDNRQPGLAIPFFIAANGEMMMAGFTNAPSGWTACDGRVFPIAGHNYAYFNIGSAYGGDGGFSSFAIPDTRGRIILGDDNTNTWPLGKVNGSNDLVLGVIDMPAHTHPIASGVTGSTGGAGNTANNYQPGLVLRQLLSLSGDFPDRTQNTGVNFPMLAEMRLIAGTSADGLDTGHWPTMYGQALSISQNNALFSLLGNYYGGNGSTTFALPDLRGRADATANAPADAAPNGTNLTIGTVVGSATLGVSLSQLATHAHSLERVSITGEQHFSDGHVVLTLQGVPGTTAQVEGSNNLTTWSSLGQLTFSTAPQTIPDPNPTQSTKRFYYAHVP